MGKEGVSSITSKKPLIFLNVHNTSKDRVKVKYKVPALTRRACSFCKKRATGYNHCVKATQSSRSFKNKKSLYLVQGCQSCNMKKGELVLKKNREIYKAKRTKVSLVSHFSLTVGER